MPEYIEREALIEFVKQNTPHFDGETTMECVERSIRYAPTADVAEVVRCGDCKHFHEYPVVGTNHPSGWGKCTKIGMDIDLTINDFCSYGERKSDNEI